MGSKFELQFEDGEYYLVDGNTNDTVATTDKVLLKEYDGYMKKLSRKNCEAIANGYDLDELTWEEFPYNEWEYSNGSFGDINEESRESFKIGFQKALEILGDKKFSEEQLKDSLLDFISEVSSDDGELIGKTPEDAYNWIENHVQSLQQTEWDVEIEMDFAIYLTNLPKEGEERPAMTPKLDSNGCLVLKRKYPPPPFLNK